MIKKDNFIEKLAENLESLVSYCLYWKMITKDELFQLDLDAKLIQGFCYEQIMTDALKLIIYQDLEKTMKQYNTNLADKANEERILYIDNEQQLIESFGNNVVLTSNATWMCPNTRFPIDTLYCERVSKKVDYSTITKEICNR